MTTRIPTGFCVCVAEGHPELCPNTPGRCAFKCAEYIAGKLKPAYPVPAIPLTVEWYPYHDEMYIFAWNFVDEDDEPYDEGYAVYIYQGHHQHA